MSLNYVNNLNPAPHKYVYKRCDFVETVTGSEH